MQTSLTPEAAIVSQAFEIANDAVISDIESEAHAVSLPGSALRWWDIRPMVDPREHAPEFVDMAQRAIDYALGTGLAERHPIEQHLLRITRA